MTTLESARLSLTSWTLDDAPEAFALWSDPAVMRFVGQPHRTVAESRAALEQELASEQRHGVCLWRLRSHEGEVLGCCGFQIYDGPGSHRPGTRWLELAYHLRPTVWRRGYATEAAQRCLDHARATSWTHVVALCHPDNRASSRVLADLGFDHDGRDGELNRHLLVL